MICKYRRCNHCRDIYLYYETGRPYDMEYNDSRYCETCYKATLDALGEIPKKFEEVWIEDPEITKEDIEGAIKFEEEQDQRDSGKVWFKEVAMPLYDLDNPSNKNITGYIDIGKTKSLYSWWTEKGTCSIRKQMEKNLETGEMVPWKL